MTQVDDGARLVLRGDANSVDDALPYDVTQADRVIASVPRAGYVVAVLSGPIGVFGGGLLVGLTLLIAFGRGSRGEKSEGDEPGSATMADALGGLNFLRASLESSRAGAVWVEVCMVTR